MKDGFLEDLILVLTALTLACGLLGIGWRVVVVPWLKLNVSAPVQETNHQVKVNGHTSNPPTLIDTVHTVAEEVAEAKQAFHVAALMFEGHVNASELDRAALWAAVGRLEQASAAAVDRMDKRLTEHLATLTETRQQP